MKNAGDFMDMFTLWYSNMASWKSQRRLNLLEKSSN
jgi:hypothetical protein